MEQVIQRMIAFLRAIIRKYGIARGWSNLVKDGVF